MQMYALLSVKTTGINTETNQKMDAFVRGILDDEGSPKVSDQQFLASSPDMRSESMRTIVGEPLLTKAPDSVADQHNRDGGTMHKAQMIFRYSLIFINFTFIVASMLLIMAGVVARENSAVKLCDHCGDLTTVAIVFGIVLWLFAMFGFNWIRQRNILLLLVYVAFLILLMITLLGIIIAAGAFDHEAASNSESGSFLEQWIDSVNNSANYVCDVQKQFNCSGYQLGCCVPTLCFNASEPPGWVAKVCPVCADAPTSDVMCTSAVYDTLRKNLGGFLVISCFSMLLVLTGILLAFLSRKFNQVLA